MKNMKINSMKIISGFKNNSATAFFSPKLEISGVSLV